MNHASSSSVDTESKRYLRHHAVLEAARSQAHTYLNQIWLQLNRIISRELGGDLRQDNWIEIISPQDNEIVGLRWRANSLKGGVILEVADVRRWTQVSGDHIVYTISSQDKETRAYLVECCSDYLIENAFQNMGSPVSLLKYGSKSSRVISIASPLRFTDPRQEAQTVIEGIVSLWEIIEKEPTTDGDTVTSRHEPDYSKTPRYASAAPPVTTSEIATPERTTPERATPERIQPTKPPSEQNIRSIPRASISSRPAPATFPPTLAPQEPPPVDDVEEMEMQIKQDQIHPGEQLLVDEVEQAFAGMSKAEMIQAIQAQVRQRPGRLIRGGERKAAPVLSEPPRFIPRSLEANEGEVVQTQAQRLESEEGRVVAPDSTAESVDLANVVTKPINPPATSLTSELEKTLSAKEQIEQPSYIMKLDIDQEVVDPSASIIKASPEDQSPEDYDPSAHEGLPLEGNDLEPGEIRMIEAKELDARSLKGILDRLGMSPWRVNSYDEGRGQILWLNNGAHIDYNPAGEVILGGENQDETRARLSQMGIIL